MPAAIPLVAMAVSAAGAAYAANQQKKAASRSAEAAETSAREDAAAQQAIAKQETEAAAKRQADAQQFEIERTNAQALTAQNTQVSALTPTVQLAATADEGDGTAKAARNRRAAFKPEYNSGVSI